MKTFKIEGVEFITLGQFVKAAGLVSTGGMVKPFLEETKILYNGEPENRRGKKIYPKDKVQIGKDVYIFEHD
ncbi:RNA-binding S4 domain-containing protein [Paracholeplasma manati]|uniref:RNA-binding S4 domain-containing protein n=1 Tax=Paracholeplasma manati TaxID=591373 RepID=UPI00240817BC|nr:RNA-binding S4 domain-containing protein [Paracholeplasma manati]MDG0889322.1 RNA-binding S4 domain-containing protein [Paracholeplasma manati]MDX9807449.1 RNA-binding S4 domain-containing protein [Acholeplasma sp.]